MVAAAENAAGSAENVFSTLWHRLLHRNATFIGIFIWRLSNAQEADNGEAVAARVSVEE